MSRVWTRGPLDPTHPKGRERLFPELEAPLAKALPVGRSKREKGHRFIQNVTENPERDPGKGFPRRSGGPAGRVLARSLRIHRGTGRTLDQGLGT